MPCIREARADHVEIPLAASFATSRDTTPRRSVHICRITLRSDTGHCGVGEAVPVPYVTGETVDVCFQSLTALAQRLPGHDPAVLRQSPQDVHGFADAGPSARAAVEMALWSLQAALHGMSLWQLFGGAQQEVVTDVTLPMVDDAVERAAAFASQGFHIFKVKVGREGSSEDVDLLRRVAETVPGAVFRLDANQAFTETGALQLTDALLSCGLHVELLEQPVPKHDLAALDRVARRSPVPVLADEAVLTPDDARRLVEYTAVHGVNVKVMKSGVRGALEIMRIVREAGRRLMMGCMLETSRGIGVALSLAAGSGAFQYYDLDGHLLTEGGSDNPFFEQDGERLRISQR